MELSDAQEHAPHTVDESGHGKQTDHDAERRQQQRQKGGHLGMRLYHDANVREELILFGRRILLHILEIKIEQDKEQEHEGPGIEPRKLLAIVKHPHQDGEKDDPHEEDRCLELVVDRQGLCLDRRGGQQADTREING